MDEYILKHLQDILNAIEDLEKIFEGYPMRFDVFAKDDLRLPGPSINATSPLLILVLSRDN